jgi:RimJ/RimL family protein N-acetyltransferase
MVTPEDNNAAGSGRCDDAQIFRVLFGARLDVRAVGNHPEARLSGVVHGGVDEGVGNAEALESRVDLGVPVGEDARTGFPVEEAPVALGEVDRKAVAVGLVFDGHGSSPEWAVNDSRGTAVSSMNDHDPSPRGEVRPRMSVPEQFTTARLCAEQLSKSHYPELRVFHQNAEMMVLIGGLRDEARTATYLERHLAQWRDCGFGFYLLRDAATGAAVGTAGLRRLHLDGVDEVEVGYGFMPACWGKGLGTEIAAACVQHAFGALDALSVVALTDPAHVASQHVLTKVGLAFDRDLIREDRPMVLFRGMRR